jgi:cobalt-zinc-cadmium efflux system membrane fusion protein
MKRIILPSTALIALAVAALAIARTRPEWLPTWARSHLERKPAGQAGPGDLAQATEGGGFGAHSLLAPDLTDDGWCAAHSRPEAWCEQCAEGRDTKGSEQTADGSSARKCRQPLPTVRLASAKVAEQIGIQSAPATEESHAHRLLANAETAYAANRYASIAPRVGGFLREVRVDLGQAVRQGETLAVVDSAEVSAAKTQYLTARAAVTLAQATYDRTKSLASTGSMAARSELEALTALNQAQAAAMDAEQRLSNLGLDDGEIARTLKSKGKKSLLDVVAPIDGTVVLLRAVRGEAVQPTTQLFATADTSRMWLWIDVYESEVGSVALGQPVRFTISGTDSPIFSGEVSWVGTEVNPITRTTRVRAGLANPEGRLRANQFGKAAIRVSEEHTAVVVPAAAVQRNDGADLVFIPQGESSYRPQRIVTRPMERDDVAEVLWGLKAGQQVVTNGAYRLKTEIMKRCDRRRITAPPARDSDHAQRTDRV